MATLQSIKEWKAVTEILVVGCGLSGTVAAITAHDLDKNAEVMIIENKPEGLGWPKKQVNNM